MNQLTVAHLNLNFGTSALIPVELCGRPMKDMFNELVISFTFLFTCEQISSADLLITFIDNYFTKSH
jgi:hypothetical protein